MEKIKVAIPGRLELPTYGLGNRRSILLSYGTADPVNVSCGLFNSIAERSCDRKPASEVSFNRHEQSSRFSRVWAQPCNRLGRNDERCVPPATEAKKPPPSNHKLPFSK